MKAFKVPIIALAAILLGACGTDATRDEPATPASAATATPVPAEAAPAPAPASTPTPDKPSMEIKAYAPHIDASAFLNALVESGCQIDRAEYKEVKRGGAIKIVCSKTVDPLNVELDDL